MSAKAVLGLARQNGEANMQELLDSKSQHQTLPSL